MLGLILCGRGKDKTMLIYQPEIPVIDAESGEVVVTKSLQSYHTDYGQIQQRIHLDNCRGTRQYYITIMYYLEGIVRHGWEYDDEWRKWRSYHTALVVKDIDRDTVLERYYDAYDTRFFYKCTDICILHINHSSYGSYPSFEGTFILMFASATPIYSGMSQLFLYGLSRNQAVV